MESSNYMGEQGYCHGRKGRQGGGEEKEREREDQNY